MRRDELIHFDLGGRTALVTGAASGIGLSTATMLARAGAQMPPNFTGLSLSRCAAFHSAAYSSGPRVSFWVTTPG